MSMIINKILKEEIKKFKNYDEFFKFACDVFDINPDDIDKISDDKKKKLFNYIDKMWIGKNEKKNDKKEESLSIHADKRYSDLYKVKVWFKKPFSKKNKIIFMNKKILKYAKSDISPYRKIKIIKKPNNINESSKFNLRKHVIQTHPNRGTLIVNGEKFKFFIQNQAMPGYATKNSTKYYKFEDDSEFNTLEKAYNYYLKYNEKYNEVFSNNKYKVTVTVKYARIAIDILDDKFRRINVEKDYTNSFKFENKNYAIEFIEELISNGIPEKEISTNFSNDILNEKVSINHHNKHNIKIGITYSHLADEIFKDIYKRIGKRVSTNIFAFDNTKDALDFISTLKDEGIPEKEIFHDLNESTLIENINENNNNWIGGTVCSGGCFMGKSGISKILKISKSNPNKLYYIRDDNYSNYGPYFLNNGKLAKAKTNNPSYDFKKYKIKSIKCKSDVIWKYKLLNNLVL